MKSTADHVRFDNTQAAAEGWSLYFLPETKERWQLQRAPGPHRVSDVDAAQFVVDRAQAGSAYHIGALEFLKQQAEAM